jgi:hypothetical protein
MPRRARLSGSMVSSVVCVLPAIVAVGMDSPAQAECVAQLNQQQAAPDGAHWSLHYDRAKNRRCWILVDAAGHEVSPTPQAQPQQSTSPALSTFQTFIGNFTGGGPPSPPAQEAPAAAATPAPAPPPRRTPAHVASPNRVEHAARTEQREKSDPVKHELTEPEREALFEEFLRWHESQQIIGTVNSSRQ